MRTASTCETPPSAIAFHTARFIVNTLPASVPSDRLQTPHRTFTLYGPR